MPWSGQKTWAYADVVGDIQLDLYIRDASLTHKASMDDDGALKKLVRGFAYGGSPAGGGGNTGSADTHLSAYDVAIPANFMDQPGDTLIIEGLFANTSTAGTYTARVVIEGGTKQILYQSTTVNSRAVVHARIVRRTSTTGALTSVTWHDALHGGAPTPYLQNAGIGTVDWTADQTLQFWVQHSSGTDNAHFLTDLDVRSARGVTGTLV